MSSKTKTSARTKARKGFGQGRSEVAEIGARARAMADTAQMLWAALADGRPSSEAITMLRTLGDGVQSLRSIANDLEALERSLKQQVDRDFLELEHTFRQECGARRWSIDGQWPRLYIERAIPVDIDESRRVVSVAGKSAGPATIEVIIEQLEGMIPELMPRKFSAQVFMASLVRAYDALHGGSTQVPIRRVYKQLVLDQQKAGFWDNARTDAFVGMSLEQFRARISHMLADGMTSGSGGRELRLLPPLDPKDAIFLYQPAEGRFGFVGRIEFFAARHAGE